MASLADIAQNASDSSEALVLLHDAGASPVLAIRALMEGRGIPLAESKAALMASPAWAAEAKAAESLHDQIAQAIEFDR